MTPEKDQTPQPQETPRYYFTREEFRALIEQELHPRFIRLEKKMDHVGIVLKAFTSMLFTFKEMVKRKLGLKPHFRRTTKAHALKKSL